MKHFFRFLIVVLFMITTSEFIMAQNFTVKVPLTDRYGGLFKPIKAGGSFQFKISVTNNSSDTYIVSLDKNSMFKVKSWVTIENNNQTIFSGQTVIFRLTIKVPSGTSDGNYSLPLYFNAYDKNYVNHPFNYYTQTIIVDNSKPITPSFSIGQTSTTISVFSWSSWDSGSIEYTDADPTSGLNGIANYTVTLKDINNALIKKESFKADDNKDFKVTGLASYTKYKVIVEATDLAGNFSIKDSITSTTPAKPANLSFSNTEYGSTTLSWTPSPGATGYNVFLNNGSINTLLNNTPVTTNSYRITGLKPDTTYAFYVRALSNVGPSDWSDKATVKTLALPPITGSSVLCTGNYTFSVENLIAGYIVTWSNSTNLSKISASGTSAVFNVTGSGQAWIGASITAPYGQNFELTKKTVWLGKPDQPITSPSGYPTYQMALGQIKTIRIVSALGNPYQYVWNITGSITKLSGGGIQCTVEATTTGWGNFYVNSINECGTSVTGGGSVNVSSGGGGGLLLSPNPANNILTVEIGDNKTPANLNNIGSKTSELRVYDKMMNLKMKKTFRGRKTQINVRNLKQGVYILQIISGNRNFKKEIMISHH